MLYFGLKTNLTIDAYTWFADYADTT